MHRLTAYTARNTSNTAHLHNTCLMQQPAGPAVLLMRHPVALCLPDPLLDMEVGGPHVHTVCMLCDARKWISARKRTDVCTHTLSAPCITYTYIPTHVPTPMHTLTLAHGHTPKLTLALKHMHPLAHITHDPTTQGPQQALVAPHPLCPP